MLANYVPFNRPSQSFDQLRTPKMLVAMFDALKQRESYNYNFYTGSKYHDCSCRLSHNVSSKISVSAVTQPDI